MFSSHRRSSAGSALLLVRSHVACVSQTRKQENTHGFQVWIWLGYRLPQNYSSRIPKFLPSSNPTQTQTQTETQPTTPASPAPQPSQPAGVCTVFLRTEKYVFSTLRGAKRTTIFPTAPQKLVLQRVSRSKNMLTPLPFFLTSSPPTPSPDPSRGQPALAPLRPPPPPGPPRII